LLCFRHNLARTVFSHFHHLIKNSERFAGKADFKIRFQPFQLYPVSAYSSFIQSFPFSKGCLLPPPPSLLLPSPFPFPVPIFGAKDLPSGDSTGVDKKQYFKRLWEQRLPTWSDNAKAQRRQGLKDAWASDGLKLSFNGDDVTPEGNLGNSTDAQRLVG
jgi:hypothetical protein